MKGNRKPIDTTFAARLLFNLTLLDSPGQEALIGFLVCSKRIVHIHLHYSKQAGNDGE